jgi:hypothetical protein
MREIRASGSVGGEGGNALAYPAGDKLPTRAEPRQRDDGTVSARPKTRPPRSSTNSTRRSMIPSGKVERGERKRTADDVSKAD